MLNKDYVQISKDLAEAHWEYIKGVLLAHKVSPEIVNLCAFHYKAAFIHGWKHAKEDQENGH